MYRPSGSWVAIPTPFNEDGSIDYGGFSALIDFHIVHGTSALFVMGSAGEVTLLSLEERREIVRRVVNLAKGKIPVFFGGTFPTTEDTISFCKYIEGEGADGIVLTVPPYLILSQDAILEHFTRCMQAVSLPMGIYNNPTRVGVNVDPATIVKLAERCPNFVVDKEAMPHVSQLVEVKRRLGDRLNILCCDFPKYSILLPTLALGGNGAANISGNIIPEEMAEMAKPWHSFEQVEKSRSLYFRYYPLIEALYWLSNPIVIKAALRILGLPAGNLRRPYLDLEGEKLIQLRNIMEELGVINKYKA